jgi:hypothetical protein
MNLIDKPIVESTKIMKQKSTTLPPKSTANYSNSTKIDLLVKPKQSTEGLITTVNVNNNNPSEFNKSDFHKNSKSSTPNKLATANFNNSNNEDSNNNNKDKQQKTTVISLTNTPIKKTTTLNKGFSNMSFNDS